MWSCPKHSGRTSGMRAGINSLANFPRKISKKTSQTTAVSQNNLEIVEMFIESCKREQKKIYGELKNFRTQSLVK